MKQVIERLRKLADDAVKEYNAEHVAGGESVYPSWADDVRHLISHVESHDDLKKDRKDMREVLFFTSYCGGETEGCVPSKPCHICLGMSNVYLIPKDVHMKYLRELAPELNSDAKQDADSLTAADYEEALADHRRLVRELDVLLNGEEMAAKQASLCDIVSQVRREVIKAAKQDTDKMNALCDSNYLAGAKEGWNLAAAGDSEGFRRLFDSRIGYLAPIRATQKQPEPDIEASGNKKYETLKERTEYLLHGHKQAFNQGPKKADLQKHIKALDAEIDNLLSRQRVQPASGEDASKANAIHAAVAAIYFDDSSDYLTALWEVVRSLSQPTADLLESNRKQAYDQSLEAMQQERKS